jgi:hypothetical protein
MTIRELLRTSGARTRNRSGCSRRTMGRHGKSLNPDERAALVAAFSEMQGELRVIIDVLRRTPR